jgi:hypothetical protein
MTGTRNKIRMRHWDATYEHNESINFVPSLSYGRRLNPRASYALAHASSLPFWMLWPTSPPAIEPVALPPHWTTCPVVGCFSVTSGVAQPVKAMKAGSSRILSGAMESLAIKSSAELNYGAQF